MKVVVIPMEVNIVVETVHPILCMREVTWGFLKIKYLLEALKKFFSVLYSLFKWCKFHRGIPIFKI